MDVLPESPKKSDDNASIRHALWGTNTSLASAIRHLRQAKKISARQLSIMSGLSPSYVSKIESHEIEPSFKAFARLANSLDMTLLEIAYCVMVETKDQDGQTQTETVIH